MKTRLPINHDLFLFTKKILRLAVIGGIVTAFPGCSMFPDSDMKRIQGVWETRFSNNQVGVIMVEGDSFIILDVPNFDKKYKFTLDPDKTPKQFTISNFENNEDAPGIYELSDKRLKVEFAEKKGAPFPSTFTDKDIWLFDYKGESANFSPVDSSYTKGVKTWNYWIRFSEINKSNNLGTDLKNATTPEQFIETCKQLIETVRRTHSAITALPLSGVDSEVTSYASEYLDNLNLLESSLTEELSIVRDAQDLVARRNSDETLAKSIMELFLGKPGTTIEALDAEAQEIKSRGLKFQEKATQGREESAKLGTKQVKLRSSLSNKYNREFPEVKI